MADYPYYDEDPKRRRRRQRRRSYQDDAWGMAEYEDYGDGSYADAEDYAAGMVDEERYAARRYNRNRYDEHPSAYDEEGNHTVAASPANEQDWRTQHIGESSEGVERAADLLARLNRRNSYRSRSSPKQPALESEARRKTPPSAAHDIEASPPRRSVVPTDPNVTFTFAMVFMLTMALISCVALVMYAAFG